MINKKDEWQTAVSLCINAIYTDNPYEILKLKNAEIRGDSTVQVLGDHMLFLDK